MIAAEVFKRCTVAEFHAMEKEENYNYELIDGVVLMSPRPTIRHQKISLRLSALFLALLQHNGCDVVQEVDLVLADNHFIPDIMITCGEQFEGQRHTKPPLIVVEIVSPHNASHDYVTKRYKYEQLGIKEYWIVAPEENCIWVISFEHNEQIHYCKDQHAQSMVMPELTVDLNAVFV